MRKIKNNFYNYFKAYNWTLKINKLNNTRHCLFGWIMEILQWNSLHIENDMQSACEILMDIRFWYVCFNYSFVNKYNKKK